MNTTVAQNMDISRIPSQVAALHELTIVRMILLAVGAPSTAGITVVLGALLTFEYSQELPTTTATRTTSTIRDLGEGPTKANQNTCKASLVYWLSSSAKILKQAPCRKAAKVAPTPTSIMVMQSSSICDILGRSRAFAFAFQSFNFCILCHGDKGCLACGLCTACCLHVLTQFF